MVISCYVGSRIDHGNIIFIQYIAWAEAQLDGPKMPVTIDWGKSDYELFRECLPPVHIQLEDLGDLFPDAA